MNERNAFSLHYEAVEHALPHLVEADRFVRESQVSDAVIEINDNNATPVVVSMRMRQAIEEARKEAE